MVIQVRDLLKRLGYTQTQMAREYAKKYGGGKSPCLWGVSSWLNGKNIGLPSVAMAGAKATKWYEDNKCRGPPPLPFKAEDIARVRLHTSSILPCRTLRRRQQYRYSSRVVSISSFPSVI